MRSFCAYLCVLVLALLFLGGRLTESKCQFKAIFNFGDSNSDTGGFWAAFPAQSGPFGMTYFKRPVGRATDGRLMVDFLAQAFGIPYLSPYLQSIGSDFRHGANFATLASTVLYPQTSLYVSGLSPFSLGIQVRQLKEFKVRVDQHHSSGSTNLPPRDIFEKSLYTFYIGQNDFTSELKSMSTAGVQKILPYVVNEIANTVKEIYGIGGRTFWIMNMAPVGCYPALLTQLPHNITSDLDKFGCLKPINDAVTNYNTMLKNKVTETRQSLRGATITLVDVYSLLLELFRYPTKHGLQNGVKACCGHGGGMYNYNKEVYCGNSKVVNGKKVTARACKDPQRYVSWDGVHATEVANKLVTAAILNGSSFDPSFPVHRLCDLHRIG